MEDIYKELKRIILEIKNTESDFTPITIDIAKYFNTRSYGNLVLEINEDMESVLSHIKEILYFERLADIVHGFNFTLKACLYNQKELTVINELLLKISGISIDKNEMDFALRSPKEFVQSKIDYKTDAEIQKLFDARISVYNYTQNDNTNYTLYKKAFVISVILLKNEIEKYFNPIEEISNDYLYLKGHYTSKGIDLMNDPQFSSYQLISVNDNFNLQDVYPPRVYDINCGSTIFLNVVEDYVYKYLLELYNKYKFNLSLKPSSIFFLNGEFNLVKIEEHLETGKYFDINNLKQKLITKLYNEEYDNLWINVDYNDLTFEEILRDFSCYKDMIVTQVVHCQYIIDNDKIFITHLDHEFIFYTIDEFDKRQTSHLQKGGAMTRIKTFKIDNSKIPITENDNALFMILKMKFKNTELLEEYFDKIEEN